jgi:hypothetical protein
MYVRNCNSIAIFKYVAKRFADILQNIFTESCFFHYNSNFFQNTLMSEYYTVITISTQYPFCML